MADNGHSRRITALSTKRTAVEIVPAPRWREWMSATAKRNANRCLPLLMANEAGWVLRNPCEVTITWDGSDRLDAISFDYPTERRHAPGSLGSHFGYGIVTFGVPYLFRTPPGYNLLARGPANWPKDGICALEGLVEADWSVATFTMNWKLTRPDNPVTFEEGEPFCMVVPQRRGELESFDSEIRPLKSEPATRDAAKQWHESRHRMHVKAFLGEHSKEFEEYRGAWEADYFKGRYPGGKQAPEHQTKLRLSEFTRSGE